MREEREELNQGKENGASKRGETNVRGFIGFVNVSECLSMRLEFEMQFQFAVCPSILKECDARRRGNYDDDNEDGR
jgi:hypothetical protein